MKTYSEEEINELYEDEPEDVNCPFCRERGYLVRLGHKLLMNNEPRPADYENFLECPKCYEVIPIHEIPKEETIKDSVETIDNPFDSGKFHVETIAKRYTKQGKKDYAKRKNKKIKLDDDPEIDTLLRVYGDRVNILK